MINWPDSPTPGQVFNPGTGAIYTWDGVAWNLTPVKVATARTRNRIVNPSMQISQEVGTAAVTTNGAYPADQWMLQTSGIVGAGQRTAGLNVTPEGLVPLIQIYASTAKPSLAAGDLLAFNQSIEGLDVADLGWGTPQAQPIVLRATVGAAVAGLYGVSIANVDGSRSWCGTINVPVGTLQTVTLAIPGDTSGTWAKDNTAGLLVRFTHAAGSSWTGVAGWQTGNKLAPPGCVNGAAVASSALFVTNVGLYADPENTGLPPPFIVPPYEDDLLQCQRYYEQVGMTLHTTASLIYCIYHYYKAYKRALPTVSLMAGNANGGAIDLGSLGVASFRQSVAATIVSDVTYKANARM